MMRPPCFLRFFQGLTLLVIFAFGRAAAEDARDAAEAVETAGVRQGLCVLLGCGRAESPGLIAELAEHSQFLVHGLALDDAACERARKAIDTKGLTGRASVERAPLNPLAYLNDLARVVVVEDSAALAAQGLKIEEILRIVSPNGVLLSRENGKWVKTLKPMPKEMDEWTHPQHGADGNQVSTDSILTIPAGVRWLDGLPVVASFRAGTGAYVATGGRVFSVGINELENLSIPSIVNEGLDSQYFPGYPQYLTARDAFSGIPLWKVNLGSLFDGGAGNWLNYLALAADEKRAYAAGKEKIVIADAATGKIVAECKTKYTPLRILLLDNVVVASGWEKSTRRNGDWVMLPKANATAGSVDAFEADTGKPLWSFQTIAYRFVASSGVIYLETNSGAASPATAESMSLATATAEIVALDLKTGKERWRVSREKLGCAGELCLASAGPGFVTAMMTKEKKVAVLAAADGSVRFQVLDPRSNTVRMMDGFLCLNGKKYDPETGTIKGEASFAGSYNGCQQTSISPNLALTSYGLSLLHAKTEAAANGPFKGNTNGFRSACVMSWMPAYGMAYTAANPCACKPGAMFGFTAIGPSGNAPSDVDFEKPRPTEKGPAFGPLGDAPPETNEWTTFRHDSERSAATTVKLPDELKELWRTAVVKPGDDILSNAWHSLGTPVISAPVIQGGRIFVSAADLGQVIALDAATSKTAWTATLGSRITGPPTLYRGLCVIGCHDGWVYALSAKDGQLAWRTRIAPWERRIVAFGRVESVWPAAGPVLVHDNVLYATAGRTSEAEGGVAMAALDPSSGALLWCKEIGPGPQRVNDALALRDGLLAWHYLRFDPKSGNRVAPEKIVDNTTSRAYPLLGATIDASWTLIPNHRRAGNAYMIGDLYASQLTWNEKTVVTPVGSIPREKTKDPAGKTLPADNPAWKYTWPSAFAPQTQRVEALVMTQDAVLYAGRITDPKTKKMSGFFRIVSLENGKKIVEFPLECPPSCDGLAVAGDRVYLSLSNGQLLCFGK